MECGTDVEHYSVTLQNTLSVFLKKKTNSEDFSIKLNAHQEKYQKINFDPLTAKYWEDYKKHSVWNLNPKEIEILQKNGFVVSERLGSKSFGSGYLTIYNYDLPVFITADSMLHVWHKAYDGMLEDLEKKTFTKWIDMILRAMHGALPKNVDNPLLQKAVEDVEYFILVALNLLIPVSLDNTTQTKRRGAYYQEDQQPPPPSPSSTKIKKMVENTLSAIKDQKMQNFILFGRNRHIDFTQFKPRGHYEKSLPLQHYFRCMMWLGRIDMRIAGGEEGESNFLELGVALLMNDILSKLPEYDLWKKFDKAMQIFVGSTDSLTFQDIQNMATTIGVPSEISNVFSQEKLEEIQKSILNSKLGKQFVTSHVYEKQVGTGTHDIPRSFTFMGQRYTMDAWVLGQLVYPNIQMRTIPSCVDVGFTVFGNDECASILSKRMNDQNGKPFRDGIPISNEANALRQSLDVIPENIWHNNLYTLWLKALRCLSNAVSSPNSDKFPQIMRTKEWAHRDMETQFASWAQLRHDTILYAKQSYSEMMTLCDYPTGFVDPRVEFWDVLIEMGNRVKEVASFVPNFKGSHWLHNWLNATLKLRQLAQKEIDQEPFSKEESEWIKSTIHKYYVSGSGGGWHWDGWYCHLFWDSPSDSEEFDPIVADVHSAPPSPDFGFNGTVVSEGVGAINMMIAAVDNGKDLTMYAGPVFSHFEIIPNEFERYSDSEWKVIVEEGRKHNTRSGFLDYPEWSQGYVVVSHPNVSDDARVNNKKSKTSKWY